MMKGNSVSYRAVCQAILALVFLSVASAVDAGGLPSQSSVFVYECDNLATIVGRQVRTSPRDMGHGIRAAGSLSAWHGTDDVRR